MWLKATELCSSEAKCAYASCLQTQGLGFHFMEKLPLTSQYIFCSSDIITEDPSPYSAP